MFFFIYIKTIDDAHEALIDELYRPKRQRQGTLDAYARHQLGGRRSNTEVGVQLKRRF